MSGFRINYGLCSVLLGCLLSVGAAFAQAEEALCAQVKIEILQELTLERQGFERSRILMGSQIYVIT